jgi:hypothetical protein
MNKKAKYWIYIIPDYQWKDGSIGKIGVTDNLERRAKQYKLESLTILEEHTNAKEVSKREIELQKQYGFKVDTREYWKTIVWQRKGNKVVGKPEIREKMSAKVKKPINQYDLEGNFIKQWDGIIEATKFLNKNFSVGIIACCQGKQKTAYKFKWEYAN